MSPEDGVIQPPPGSQSPNETMRELDAIAKAAERESMWHKLQGRPRVAACFALIGIAAVILLTQIKANF